MLENFLTMTLKQWLICKSLTRMLKFPKLFWFYSTEINKWTIAQNICLGDVLSQKKLSLQNCRLEPTFTATNYFSHRICFSNCFIVPASNETSRITKNKGNNLLWKINTLRENWSTSKKHFWDRPSSLSSWGLKLVWNRVLVLDGFIMVKENDYINKYKFKQKGTCCVHGRDVNSFRNNIKKVGRLHWRARWIHQWEEE